MNDVPGEDWSARTARLALRWYRVHAWLYGGVVLVLHIINIWQGAPWWAFWPTLVWGIPFSVHFFIYKSLTVDEAWADARIDDLRERSYDIAHMDDLEDRIRADDGSTRPAHRRDPDWWRQPSAARRDTDEDSPS